jgi:predicted dehydrogenase
MERKLRLGIIGVGQIGKQHLGNWAKIPEVEVVAACDIDKAELDRVADKFSIPNKYAAFRELLNRDDLDAVDVCLHNNMHAPAAIAVMESGKHCYCEKPMAGSYADAVSMVECSRTTGKMLHIQLAFLYTPETKIAKRLIDAGRLGRIYHARSTGYRRRNRPFVDGYGTEKFVQKSISGGGALYDMGVYHISQLLFLLGMPRPTRISGQVYQETPIDPRRRASSGYCVEELGLGLVRFEDTAITSNLTMDIIESWAIHMNPFDGSFIAGSEGGLRLDPLAFYSNLEDIEANTTFEVEHTDWRWHQLDENLTAYDSSQAHWAAALQGRVPLLPTAQIALQTMLISEGIYHSSQLRREVTIEEVLAGAKPTSLRI